MRPHLGGVTGGLSGPAVRPVAVRAVWQVAAAMPGVPIIGVGGIRTGADALEFIAAGATAVQVGTAIFNDPQRADPRSSASCATSSPRAASPRSATPIGFAHRS